MSNERAGRQPIITPICYNLGMTKIIEKAIEEMSNLPDGDQEQIGRSVLSHIEKLQKLRIEIDRGIRSLDTRGGRRLDLEDFIRRMHNQHGAP